MAKWVWGLEGGAEPHQRQTSPNIGSLCNKDSILLYPEKCFMQTCVTTH